MWKIIPGTPYSVSSAGEVRNDRTGRVLVPMMVGSKNNKRAKVVLCYDGIQQGRMVHHLVAEAFIGPRPDGHVIRHKNDDRTDNRARNLCYGTQSENMADAVRNGKIKAVVPLKVRAQIRKRRAAGEKGRLIAKQLGISEQLVCDIYKGRK